MGTGCAVTAQRGCKIFSEEEVAPAAAGRERPTRVIVSRRVWKPEAAERTDGRKGRSQSEAYQTSKWQSPVRGRSRYPTRFQGVREIGGFPEEARSLQEGTPPHVIDEHRRNDVYTSGPHA